MSDPNSSLRLRRLKLKRKLRRRLEFYRERFLVAARGSILALPCSPATGEIICDDKIEENF